MGSISSLDTHFTPVRELNDLKDFSDLDHRIAHDHVADEEDEVEEMVVGEKELLLPPRKGGMSRHDDHKTRRKVKWNDSNGNSLVQVLEFDPSDESESDEEDMDSCICTIM